MYEPVQAVEVSLWGHRVGVVAHDIGQGSVFQYFPDFRNRGIEIAPFTMPIRGEIYRFSDFQLPRNTFLGLPGILADSLPDSFGNRLIRKYMQDQGIDAHTITPLDQLAYIGSRGMGALVYAPEIRRRRTRPSAIDMRQLVEESRLAMNENLAKLSGSDALREIIRVGTSAGGAQAKAVVGWNRTTGEFLAGDDNLPGDFEHWIVKFTPKSDPEAGRREYDFYRKATAVGIQMSECRLYSLDGVDHFMTRRFDREGETRLLMATYCAMKHLPQSAPAELLTYEGLFETIDELGLGYEAMEQMFRRMAFNVIAGEHDDHTKNFAFLMREGGHWELAPAYDLTGSHVSAVDRDFNEWTNRHALSVNGRTSAITDADLLAVAERFGIGTAPRLLEQIKDALADLRQ